MPPAADVLVIGGGPAGSTIALRLAALGFAVVLVEQCPFPRRRIGESVPRALLPLLDRLGVGAAMSVRGCIAETGAVIRWAGIEEGSSEISQAFAVDRAGFDDCLLDAARQAGVDIRHPATAAGLHRLDDGSWRSEVVQDGRRRDVRSRAVVVAAGRRGGFGGRRRRYSPPTIALHSYWRCRAPLPGKGLVEAGERYWFWAAPLPDGVINVAVFCAPDDPDLRGAAGPAEAYRGLLSRSRLLRPLLANATPEPVTATDSSRQMITPVVSGSLLRVGDAAFSIDPLSAQGVLQAVASGFQGAAIINTLLRRPKEAAAAESFAASRQEEAVLRDRRLGADYYRRQAAVCGGSFWMDRAHEAIDEPEDPEEKADLPGPEVLVRLSSDAIVRSIPVLVGDFVETAPALDHPSLERPLAFWRNVPVASFLPALRRPCPLGAVFLHWSERMPSDLAFRLVETLWRKRIIVQSDQAGKRSRASTSAATR